MHNKETHSTCPYCGTGCGVIIESTGNRITGVRGDPTHPANFGRLCTKGSTLHLTATQPVALQTRLLTPLHRTQRGQAPGPIGWDAALDMAAEKFADIVQAHGPDAVGFYVSGQLLTEDYYVFNKAGQGADRHQQHRHQFPPVHEQRRRGLQGHAGRGRAAGLL